MPSYPPPKQQPKDDWDELRPSPGQAVAVGVLVTVSLLASRGRIRPSVGTFLGSKAKEAAIGIGLVGFSQIQDHYEKTLLANPTKENIQKYLASRDSPTGKYVYTYDPQNKTYTRITAEDFAALEAEGFVRRPGKSNRTPGKVEMSALWNADP